MSAVGVVPFVPICPLSIKNWPFPFRNGDDEELEELKDMTGKLRSPEYHRVWCHKCDIIHEINEKNYSNEMKHVRSNHGFGVEGRFTCSVCKKSFRDKEAKNKHFCNSAFPTGELAGKVFAAV